MILKSESKGREKYILTIKKKIEFIDYLIKSA